MILALCWYGDGFDTCWKQPGSYGCKYCTLQPGVGICGMPEMPVDGEYTPILFT